MTKVFVYGTLKRGFSNHARYLHGAEFLGEAITLDCFDMVDVGFPVVLPQQKEEAFPVLGEVYRVLPQQLTRLDQLEQNGRMYIRQTRAVQITKTGVIMPVDIYVGKVGIWTEARPVEPVRDELMFGGFYQWKKENRNAGGN